MSQEDLGEKVRLSKFQVSRIESEDTRLDVDTAQRIADALGVDLTEVLGVERAVLRADAAEYRPADGEPLSAISLGASFRLYEVLTGVVDELGFEPGNIVLVDIGQTDIEKIAPLTVLLAAFLDASNHESPVTLLRQYVPPNLLTTNSRRENTAPINARGAGVQIRGVLVPLRRQSHN